MKRRVLVLTEHQWLTIGQAMRYVADSHSSGQGEGDIDGRWAGDNERVLAVVDATPSRDVSRDVAALDNVLGAASTNSCSCVSGGVATSTGHASDCYVSTSRHALDRVVTIRALLRGVK